MKGSGHIHPGPGSIGLGWSALFGAEGPSAFPAADLIASIRDRLPRPLDPSAQRELLSLGREGDPELWARALLSLADRLQRRGKVEEAQVLFQALAVQGPMPEDLQATVDLARRRFAAASGEGGIGDRAERLAGQFWHEASDPYSLLGFAVGGTVFRLSHAALSSRLLTAAPGILTRGWGAKLFAQAGAFGAELPAFVLGSKLARHWGEGPQDWNAHGLSQEFLATGLTLSFLKAAGGFSRALGGHSALQQLSLYGGILLAQGVEGRLGLRPEVAGAAAHLEALATLLQFNVAGRMSDGILGESYRKAMQGIEWRRRNLDRRWFAEKSREIFPQYVMSTGSGDGKGPGEKGEPKVVELFPTARQVQEQPALKHPIEPGLALSRARTVAFRGAEHYSKILEALASFRAAAEIKANLLEKGRGEPGTIEGLRDLMAGWRREFHESLEQAREMAAELDELRFVTASKPELHKRSVSIRRMIRSLGDSSSDLAAGFERVERSFVRGNIEESLKLLASWSSCFPQRTWPQAAFPIDFESNPAQGLKVARLAGMVYGSLAKEVLRGQHGPSPALGLDPRSPRAEDPDAAPRLLTALLRAGVHDYAKILLNHVSPPALSRPSSPGETLRFLGSHDEPFRSWFSLHLPALLLHHQGRSVEVREKIQSIEFFMTAEGREANRWILDWLSMALEKEGHPRDWAAEVTAHDWTRLVYSQIAETGPLAIFAHSLAAFIRRPTEPGQALRLAMAAPEALREDVLALTGALVGAYLGRSAFSVAWLLPEVNRAFPERKANRKIEDAWLIDVGHMAFERNARLALDYREALGPPIRSLDTARGRSENPTWAAFARGLGERQSRIELLLSSAMRTAAQFVAAPAAAVQGQHYIQFHDFLNQELKKIQPILKELREYIGKARGHLNELELREDSTAWQEIEAKLLRYDEAVTAYGMLLAAARLNVETIGYFRSSDQVKAVFREKIEEFERVYAGVDQSEPSIRGDWVRRISATMDADAKKGKILKLWQQWSQDQNLDPPSSDKDSLEYVLRACPQYLLSDLAYWAEHQPQTAKAWLFRLGFLPKNSELLRDSEIGELLDGRPPLHFDLSEAQEGILYYYSVYGPRVFSRDYRAPGPSEKRQMRTLIETLPPILLGSLLQPDLRPDTFMLLLSELRLSQLGMPPDVD